MSEIKSSDPIKFLDAANNDPEINREVKHAMEKGLLSTAEEIMKIARHAGFEFSQKELELEIRKNLEKLFASGKIRPADETIPGQAIESSCPNGCLSYTKNWHPWMVEPS